MTSSSLHPLLQFGDRGTAIIKLQRLLRLHGYTAVQIDGEFGPVTQQAVLHFQQQWQPPSSGIVTAETWMSLKRVLIQCRNPELSEGVHSPAVNKLQHLLQLHGHTYVMLNSHFGAMTKAAVMDFQSQHGLRVNGIVNVQTWAALHDRSH